MKASAPQENPDTRPTSNYHETKHPRAPRAESRIASRIGSRGFVLQGVPTFFPNQKSSLGKTPFKQITFKDQGSTDSSSYIWSGDILMDLDRSQALKMTPKSIDGTDYLFIEAGGFGPKNPANWQSPIMVLKRG